MMVRIHFRKGFFPLLLSSLLMVLCLAGCAEDSSILDNGQSRQLKFSVTTHNWSNSANSNKSSDQKVPSRATPISTFDTSKNFNVIADVNKGGNWSIEVKNEIASYSTVNNIWQTSNIHYWPGAASTVNFYAYYPTSISSNITHTTGSVPVLSYTVPDNTADQIDILTSSKTGVAGDSYNQTPVDFKHVFAAVQFSVGSSGLPSGTISSITISGIKNSGVYTFGSGWTLNPGTTTFKSSPLIVINGTSGESITTGVYTFLMIPQVLSNATITLNYDNGTTFSMTTSGTWTAGNIYTYQLSKNVICNLDYTGNVQTFTAPYTGTYKIECWGARGGGNSSDEHGNGAYTEGLINLSKGGELYLYVGSRGTSGESTGIYSSDGTFNGGGGYTGYSDYNCATGGGATDIRLISGNWNDFNSLKSRIMVAAGAGGIIVGGNSNGGTLNSSDVITNYTDAAYTTADSNVSGSSQTSGYSLGIGQTSTRAGGGGGYYSGKAVQLSGAGGSSFISGYPGCNAISKSSTSTNIIHTGSPNHYSGYVFTNMEMIAGDSSMPSPAGGTETGHSGNGYARITFVSAN